MDYLEKRAIADEYLKQYGTNWDCLPDVNSLHDIEDDNDPDVMKASIIEYCNDRLIEAGFPTDLLGLDFDGVI